LTKKFKLNFLVYPETDYFTYKVDFLEKALSGQKASNGVCIRRGEIDHFTTKSGKISMVLT